MKFTVFTTSILFAAVHVNAGLFEDATKSIQDSANQSVEEAKNEASEAASGSITESAGKAQQKVAEATATQKMVASAIDASKQLEASLAGNPELQSLLTNSMASLAQGQDLVALEDLNELMDAKLTPAQTGLVKGLRTDVEVLALKRQMPQSGPVTAAADALKSGDYQTASAQLNQALQSGALTEPQKNLAKTIIGNYADPDAETAKAAEAAQSVLGQ